LSGCIAEAALKCTVNLFSGRAMKLTKPGNILIPLLVGSLLTFAAGRARAQTEPVRARITEAIDETNRVQLRGNVHPLARAEFDQGVVADSQPMNRMLLLLQRSPEQQAALSKLMEEQLTTGSANYHKWLTPEEFGKQFGPADEDIQAVTAWLGSHGFQASKVSKGRTVIEFSGNVEQVRNAFRTEIHRFNVNAETRQANVSDPQIPAALMPVVAGIVSMHNFPRKSMKRIVGAFTRTADGRVIPQFTTSGGSYVVGPADFAKIYNIPASLDGTGQHIAIVADSNINPQDVTDFRTLFSLPTNPPNIILNGPDPGLNGDEGEGDLDVQIAGMVAPNATIDFVVSEDTQTAFGIDLSALYIIDNNIAPVMSESFGSCESSLGTAGNAFYNSLWEQAAAQGITVMVAAGDPGSTGCNDFNTATAATLGLAVSGIASTPFNVAVGGTDFDDVGKQTSFWNTTNLPLTRESALGYIPETTWNDSCAATVTSATLNTVCALASTSPLLNIVGGSGGPSSIYAKPSFQSGITPNGIPAGDNHRYTPDVALFASDGPQSKSSYLLCQADGISAGSPPSCVPDSNGHFSFFGSGGTSASSPAFAGIMALINQSQVNAGKTGRQGNANLVLYKIAQTASNSCNSSSRTNPTVPAPPGCVFNDVTKGNNSVPCTGNSPNCSSKVAGTNGVLVSVASPTTPAWTTATGYDLATGLGSVNVANLATQWPLTVGTFKSTVTALTLNGATSTVTIMHGTPVTATVTVTPTSAGTPTGDVSLLAPTAVNGGIGDATLSGGTVTVSNVILPGGSYNVNARYAGDTAFAASTSTPGVPVIVHKQNSRLQYGIVTMDPTTGNITNTNATSLVYGSPYILRMDILNSTNNACQPLVTGGVTSGCAFDATGTVTITDIGSPLGTGTFTINSAGSAEDQPIQLASGTHGLSATYSGDISYNPIGPIADTVNVAKATTTTAVTASPTSIASGGTVTLTATVTSTQFSGDAPGAPGGKLLATPVQFLNGTTPISGMVQLTPSPGSANSPSLTATLTTTLSGLGIPDTTTPWRPKLPPGVFWLLGYCAALYGLFLMKMRPSRRRGYAYAGLIVFALAAAGIAGCGGGGGSNKTPQVKTVTITAKFAGDSNYTASSNTTTVTIQ
jgi:Pro-kumamolisin, activation domain/Bacterial Ig-like domain (group 3)